MRVFTTWGTLADKDDSSIMYPGWAMLDPRTQGAQLDALLSDPTLTDQQRIDRLASYMTPGSQDHIPFTTFISESTDSLGNPTDTLAELIPR